MSRQSFHKMLRGYGSVMLIEHKGTLYATDTHWLLPTSVLPDLAAVLSWWNLAVEPGKYYVDSRVWRDEKLPVSKLPDITPILAMRAKATDVVTPQSFGGHPLMVDISPSPAVLLGASAPITVNRQYLELVHGHRVGDKSSFHREPGSVTAPVWDEHGCVMPVRMAP